MTDGIEEERPGFQDIPRLVKSLIERAIDLGSARLQLAQLELKVEVRQRIRRLLMALIVLGFLIVGFSLLNVGLVTWLAASMGISGAAFALSGVYFAIGIGIFVWFRATGGITAPIRDDEEETTTKHIKEK